MTWWIAIIAVASVVQAVAIVTAALVLRRTASRADALLDYMESEMPPLVEHAKRLITHADDLTARLTRAEAAAEQAAARVASGVALARQWTMSRVWPVLGVVSAVRAVASSLARSRKRRSSRADEIAEARFVYEGGGRPVP